MGAAIPASSVVTTALQGDVLVVTIDNPPVNALGAAVRQGLLAAMQRGRNNGRCGSGGVHTGKSPGQWLCLLMTGGLLMREVILTIKEPIDRLSKPF